MGIRVCGELHKYLSAIKGRRKELAAAWDATRTLAAVFDRLDAVGTRIGDERLEDTAVLKRCLDDAQGHLLKLQDVVTELEGLPDTSSLQNSSHVLWTKEDAFSSIKYKARRAKRAITYNFQREGLKDLLVTLQQLTTALNCGIVTVIL